MSYTGRLGNVAFALESTYGTFATATKKIRIISESITKSLTTVADDSLIGQLYPQDVIKVGSTVAGSVETNLHPDEAGYWMKLLLGGEETISEPVQALIIVDYTGSELYASLEKSGDTITAKVGADSGSAAADTNFNTTGSIDVSTASFDTATELAAAINGYTGWKATYVGYADADTGDIGDFSAIALTEDGDREQSLDFACQPSSTVAKTHKFYNASADSNLGSASLTIDRTLGTGEAIGLTGIKTNSMSLSVSAADLVKASFDLKGQAEETGKTFPALSATCLEAFKATKCELWIDDLNVSGLKDISLSINNNLDDATVIGSELNEEPIRQSGSVEISGTVNLGSEFWAKRSLFLNNTRSQIKIYIEGVDLADSNVYYSLFINMKAMKFTDFNTSLSSPDRLTVPFSASLVQACGETKPIEIWVVNTDTTVY